LRSALIYILQTHFYCNIIFPACQGILYNLTLFNKKFVVLLYKNTVDRNAV
jgi:hypothetical protein